MLLPEQGMGLDFSDRQHILQGPGRSHVRHNPSRFTILEPEAHATNPQPQAQDRQSSEVRTEDPTNASESAAVANVLHHPNVHHNTNGEPPAAAAGSAFAHGVQTSAIDCQTVGMGPDVDKAGTAAAGQAQQASQGNHGQQHGHINNGSFSRATAPAAHGNALPRSGRSGQGGAGTKRKAVDAAAAEGEAGGAPKPRKPRLGGTVLIGEHSVKAV